MQRHQIADLHDLSSWRQSKKKQLGVIYANIRGLRGSKAQLELTMLPTVIHLACFTESSCWMDTSYSVVTISCLKIAAWQSTAGVDFLSLAWWIWRPPAPYQACGLKCRSRMDQCQKKECMRGSDLPTTSRPLQLVGESSELNIGVPEQAHQSSPYDRRWLQRRHNDPGLWQTAGDFLNSLLLLLVQIWSGIMYSRR